MSQYNVGAPVERVAIDVLGQVYMGAKIGNFQAAWKYPFLAINAHQSS